jgi:hypothetical protein
MTSIDGASVNLPGGRLLRMNRFSWQARRDGQDGFEYCLEKVGVVDEQQCAQFQQAIIGTVTGKVKTHVDGKSLLPNVGRLAIDFTRLRDDIMSPYITCPHNKENLAMIKKLIKDILAIDFVLGSATILALPREGFKDESFEVVV